jgi:release factor glutamine methyltransferase
MNLNDCPLPQPTTSRLGDWLKKAHHQLESVSDTPALETQMAASYVLDKPRTWIIAHPEMVIPADNLVRLNDVLARMADGYPFAYISGEREFFGRSFEVRPGLLVPRPETELLVETAINWLHAHPERRSVVDVGCGTGCIAVTIAAEINDLQIEALDIDPLALETTRHNAERLGAANLVVKKSELLAGCTGMFDLICANLPYIPSKTVDNLPAARHESRLALDGGPDGLRLIETLLDQAVSKLMPGGLILLEIETSQGQSAQVMARHYFPEAEISLHHDLAGHPRLASIQI